MVLTGITPVGQWAHTCSFSIGLHTATIAAAARLAALDCVQVPEQTAHIQGGVQACDFRDCGKKGGGRREVMDLDGSRDDGSRLLLQTGACEKRWLNINVGFRLDVMTPTRCIIVFSSPHSSHLSGHSSQHVRYRTSQQAGMRADPNRACCHLDSAGPDCSGWHSRGRGHGRTCMSDLLGWRGIRAGSRHCSLCIGLSLWNISSPISQSIVSLWRPFKLPPERLWLVICCVPDWLDLLNAFKLTTSVPTSNHSLLCCCSSLYHSLVLSEGKGKKGSCSS